MTKIKASVYQIISWDKSITTYIPCKDENIIERLKNKIPFHPYLFYSNYPCFYITHSEQDIPKIIYDHFDIELKKMPEIKVYVKSLCDIIGNISDLTSRYQRDSLGGYQRSNESRISSNTIKKGTILEVSELKNYGIYFNSAYTHNLNVSEKSGHILTCDEFEFIIEDELKEYRSYDVAQYVIENTKNKISVIKSGIDNVNAILAKTKLNLYINGILID